MSLLKRRHPSRWHKRLKSIVIGKTIEWRIVEDRGWWYIQRKWVFSLFWSCTIQRRSGKLAFIDLTWASTQPYLYGFDSYQYAFRFLEYYLSNPDKREMARHRDSHKFKGK